MDSITIANSTLTINVLNLDLSIKFYESIGLRLQKRWDNHYAQMIAPGIIIGLHPTKHNDKAVGSGNTSIGFTCDDFLKTKTALALLPVNVNERNEEGGRFLHFNDPDGTALYFIEPKW